MTQRLEEIADYLRYPWLTAIWSRYRQQSTKELLMTLTEIIRTADERRVTGKAHNIEVACVLSRYIATEVAHRRGQEFQETP